MAIISNPMSELTGPLNRVEAALTELCADLRTLDVLPGVEEGVSRTNERLAHVEQELSLTRAANEQMAATLEAIREELGAISRLLASGLAPRGQADADPAAAPGRTPPAHD